MIKDKMQKFNFGKYRGRTIYWVMKNDPGYIIWTQENIMYCNYSPKILEQCYSRMKK